MKEPGGWFEINFLLILCHSSSCNISCILLRTFKPRLRKFKLERLCKLATHSAADDLKSQNTDRQSQLRCSWYVSNPTEEMLDINLHYNKSFFFHIYSVSLFTGQSVSLYAVRVYAGLLTAYLNKPSVDKTIMIRLNWLKLATNWQQCNSIR